METRVHTGIGIVLAFDFWGILVRQHNDPDPLDVDCHLRMSLSLCMFEHFQAYSIDYLPVSDDCGDRRGQFLLWPEEFQGSMENGFTAGCRTRAGVFLG
ncbi:MAG: hypothetical protein IPN95_30395 [Bacteroidetes bacterium]|nr:hypothetical protein [Bacteroidota bacterium]